MQVNLAQCSTYHNFLAVLFLHDMQHAISNRGKKSSQSASHWLDNAADSFDHEIIKDTKGLFRILPYFIPVPMFFALYEQLVKLVAIRNRMIKFNALLVIIKFMIQL